MQKVGKDELSNCAIGRDNSNGSCFSLEELHTIAKNYNETTKDKKIKLWPTKKEMLLELSEKLTECSDQTCWPTLKFIKDHETLNEAFKPNGPAGQFDWLSTTEINECMERYMDVYPDFLFVGAVPIDIEDLNQFGVKNLDYDKISKKGKTKVGIVYNLDEHYKSGSHWVSFYIDSANKRIYYSDSAAKPPDVRVKRLVKKIAEKWYKKDTGQKINLPLDSYMNEKEQNIVEKKYNIKFNKTQHQFGGSECGVYSINFIIRLLRGDTFDDIHESRITDKEMNVCRKMYFKNYGNIIKNSSKLNIC
jgi:hypothetical protein